jgi:hypothetical protein
MNNLDALFLKVAQEVIQAPQANKKRTKPSLNSLTPEQRRHVMGVAAQRLKKDPEFMRFARKQVGMRLFDPTPGVQLF